MSKSLYFFSREIAVISAIIVSLILFNQGEYKRVIMNVILIMLYIFYSILYEHKNFFITPSYVFVTFVLMLTNSIFSCYFTDQTISYYNDIKTFGYFIGDYYFIYFCSMFITYVIIIIFTIISFRIPECLIINLPRKMKVEEESALELGSILLLMAFVMTKGNYEIYIPLLLCTLTRLIWGNERKRSLMLFVTLIFIGGTILLSRYLLIQIVFPLFLIFLMINKFNQKKFSFIKINIWVGATVVLVLVYGVLSEIYKLNSRWGGNYELSDLFSDDGLLMYFIHHQFYRIFYIWIKLGGYIIYHVNNHGLFYGLTYVKSIASLLGVEYISLPKLGAFYDSASYAQPGLLAEGYANFGIVGIVINVVAVYIFMEFLKIIYYRKQSFFNLILMTVPFTKIMLDGGTLNSAILLCLICLVLNINKLFLRKNFRIKNVSKWRLKI